MSEPFLAQISIVGFNFPPRGWAFCDGQILPINQNQSLYSLIGTTYGGDGRTSFALPDLRSRTPIHMNAPQQLGNKGGSETTTLSVAEIAAHTHVARAQNAIGDTSDPEGHMLAETSVDLYHEATTALATMHSGTITNTGGGQAHDNMQPYLTLSFTIALQGLFPSRN